MLTGLISVASKVPLPEIISSKGIILNKKVCQGLKHFSTVWNLLKSIFAGGRIRVSMPLEPHLGQAFVSAE